MTLYIVFHSIRIDIPHSFFDMLLSVFLLMHLMSLISGVCVL